MWRRQRYFASLIVVITINLLRRRRNLKNRMRTMVNNRMMIKMKHLSRMRISNSMTTIRTI